MIDQILKDHKPGEKPRFFLHDEMKAWLADNLKIGIDAGINHEYDYNLTQKLGIHSGYLPAGINIKVDVLIDNEVLVSQGSNTYFPEIVTALKCLSNVSEQCMIQIRNLQIQNEELKRRIELLETPLPI